MKIIVVSDTHMNLEKYSSLVTSTDADLYIHLGDGIHEFTDVAKQNAEKRFVFVKGEDDLCEASTFRILPIGGCRIFCTHGHEQDVISGLDEFIDQAKANQCNIALYGHTHLFKTALIDGIYVMNPGSLSSPRGKNNPSYGVLEISDDGTVSMNIVAY